MQNLKDVQEKLDRFDTSRLMDVVKYAKQYGYSDEIRLYALSLLNKKGISQEDLKLTGNLQNENYENAERIFKSFKINSTIAFVAYIASFILPYIASFILLDNLSNDTNLYGISLLLIAIALIIVYLFCLLKSFLLQSDFYKLTGNDLASGPLIYLFLGMPFYIIMYFVFSAQMKKEMKAIT